MLLVPDLRFDLETPDRRSRLTQILSKPVAVSSAFM